MSNGELPRFLQLSSALQEFVTVEGTQSQLHIRPLHQYLTVRMALEGGFDPDEITRAMKLSGWRWSSRTAKRGTNFLPHFLRLTARSILRSSSRRYIRCTIYATRTRLHRSQDYGDTNGRRIHRSCEHLLHRTESASNSDIPYEWRDA